MRKKISDTRDAVKSNRRWGTGIRTRLVLGFTLFVMIVLVIVWIFQVLLLDFFYERAKMSELEAVQDTIDKNINSGDLESICGELASEYDVCIVIYNVKNDSLDKAVITKEVSPACIIHYSDKSYLNTLYNQAIESDGTFTARFDLEPGIHSKDEDTTSPGKQNKPHNGNNKYDNVQHREEAIIMAVSVKAFEDVMGNRYAAFINLRFSPVNTIQNTRNAQFSYIAAVVIISSVIFALMFSSGIARPLEKMTDSAERMASGNYSTYFAVEGYRETKRLANTLNYAVDEISKTDKLQRELIANVSHDLRTPLTLISGYAEMMRDIPGENTAENSQLIVDETKRLTTLVNDMLDFSKYSSGVEEPELRTFDLTDSVNRSIARYAELIKRNGYNIEFDADQSVFVCADERMILQVLYNLINNAINYTGKDKTVIIKQTIVGDVVKISISDSGDGISRENIEKIWDRYYKVDKSHARAVSGSGLGLSIVRKLLQLHSSSYGVESSASNGTTFWFTLKISNE